MRVCAQQGLLSAFPKKEVRGGESEIYIEKEIEGERERRKNEEESEKRGREEQERGRRREGRYCTLGKIHRKNGNAAWKMEVEAFSERNRFSFNILAVGRSPKKGTKIF